MATEETTQQRGPEGPAPAGPAPPGGGGATVAKSYTSAERLQLIQEQARTGASLRSFCAAQHLSTATFCAWKRRYEAEGAAGLDPRPNPRNTRGTHRGRFTADQRREAVEAWLRSGMRKADFAVLWGVGTSSLAKWIKRYQEGGPKALEDTAPRKRRKKTLPAAVHEEIVRTKRAHPFFGLRKVRDFLYRFRGVKVSAGTVSKTLKAADLADPPPPRRKRPKKPLPRRFERALPNQLWQSDITSFHLARHSQRAYLTVFLDDHSRYVVSWAFALHQRQELVTEALLGGIARFGKPEEVLTDQGRQYFAWRGKSGFQKLLIREGIQHVVSRAHHPQTLGKCERLWATVNHEFWDRVRPQDLEEARERLSHFFAHYNHFRPHQGIGGMVPADRYFGQESEVRERLEQGMADPIRAAVDPPRRKQVYLVGQVGDQPISLHGEKGRLVIQTPDGKRQEISMDRLGIETVVKPERRESDDGRDEDAEKDAQADALQDAGAGGAGAWAVAERDGRGEGAGASDGDGDLGAVAGEDVEGGTGEAFAGASFAGVAAVAIGAERYGVRPFETAAQEGAGSDDETRGRPEEAPQADRGAGGPAGADGAIGDLVSGSAFNPGSGGGEGRRGKKRDGGTARPSAKRKRGGSKGKRRRGAKRRGSRR